MDSTPTSSLHREITSPKDDFAPLLAPVFGGYFKCPRGGGKLPHGVAITPQGVPYTIDIITL